MSKLHHPLADPDDELPVPREGDILAGKYRVEAVVGAGGMGLVVAAQHLTLGQTVAVKLLFVRGLEGARREEACARFLREGQAAARLTSDHVVRIHDVGTLDDGTPFLVMELLRGDDLATIILKQGPAKVELAAEYVVQACDAIGEAHDHGIVHRDLKPSNLFVTKRGSGVPLVKVLDFGISKAMASSSVPFEGNLTATRSVVGSPYYMSPEQVRDAKRVDARSDIWSLGMILYELLVGEPAFNGETLPAICAAIAADEPEPLRVHRPDVPEELEAIVMRCLQKDPQRRFQSVIELVRALAPFLGTEQSSTADYASRRLEESARDFERIRRFPADLPTIQNDGPDSGMRLPPAAPPREATALPPAKALPRVADASAKPEWTLASGDLPRRRDGTLVSRTGTSLPATAEDAPGDAAPLTERTPTSRAKRLAVVLLGLGVLGVIAVSTRPTEPLPAAAPAALPLHHETPSAPLPSMSAAPAAVLPLSPPAPSASAAPAPSGSVPLAKHPKPGKKPSPKPTPADIRLER